MTRAVEFSSSLRYWRGDLSDAENRSLYGRKADVHGHNYRLEVSVIGAPDPVTGMVMDLKDLQVVLDREVMARFDHRDLNRDTPWFEKDPPTPENVALCIHRLLAEALPDGMLHRVLLRESTDTWVEVLS